MIGALLFCLLAQGHGARAALAKIEIEGPCAEISLELEGAGRAVLSLERPLASGERRTLSLAVPLPFESLPSEVWSRAVAAELAKTEHARLIEIVAPQELGEVAADLLARPRPLLEARAARVPWSALLVLGAAFALALSQRRRVWAVTLIAACGAAAVSILTITSREPTPAALRILEARFETSLGEPWLAVLAGRGELVGANLSNSRQELVPGRALLECRTEAEAALFSLSSRGATLYQLRAFDPGTRRLSREVNAFGLFTEAWLREADGAWLRLGQWPLGESLPGGVAGEPPGWLVPALPMGSSIFVGRLAPESVSRAFPGEPEATTWLRGLGL